MPIVLGQVEEGDAEFDGIWHGDAIGVQCLAIPLVKVAVVHHLPSGIVRDTLPTHQAVCNLMGECAFKGVG
jgi:hypothetical protein